MDIVVSNLRDRPDFFASVAHRIWDFSWRAQGVSLDTVSDGLRDIVASELFPFALVAHDGESYLGSVLGIVSDLNERPNYSPWVAAVWVEPRYRQLHVGRTLVASATQALHAHGFRTIYLCARPARHDFYARQGWISIESDVGDHGLTVFSRSLGALKPA